MGPDAVVPPQTFAEPQQSKLSPQVPPSELHPPPPPGTVQTPLTQVLPLAHARVSAHGRPAPTLPDTHRMGPDGVVLAQ
jgi:hypothetical protein